MSDSSSPKGLCYAKPPGYFDSPINTHPFPYQHNSVYFFTDPSKSTSPAPRRVLPLPVKRRSCLCSCCLWLSALIIFLIFLTAICFFLLYFYIHPRFPEFHLDHIALSQVKISNDSGDLLLSCQFDAAVQATNKNTVLRFKYGNFNITVWATGEIFKDTLLGRGVAPGFEQGQRNVTLVRSKISVQSEVVDANTAEEIVDRMHAGDLKVSMEVSTSIKVTVGDWNVMKVPVHLLCKGIETAAAKSGSNPSCQLDLFRMLLRQLHLFKD
ncbi:hypothetical protein FCM35_KLT07455 [Carex littledalei]|uniref:Late embryogenesis abundant protein LEA-2 subgroup domain-containing protein n=1 Tax=Carex littledalei TaxID=544730 RepID=A0A833QTU3_9POAL|nr:hypothetical protein FCM35_KLT07455 [Carex littledalei]